ncbi:M28 family peptidase [Olivibacter sp. XZL3]|uniref:M28 family peptidase n=1 Tax=Olivibacter sp. XZL3 TaxID=1735116 RepID=UPI001066CC3B|nr:M28 family peptidase [Olivibacter sp. XZL3]
MSLKGIISTINLLIINSCLAQDKLPSAYADLIDPISSKKHLTIIASDEYEGRETGTKGADKAATYIAKEFSRLGLKAPVNNSYFQPVELAKKTFTVDRFKVGDHTLQHEKDFLLISQKQKQDIQADEIVFIGYGISDKGYDDLAKLDIRGKTVLLLNEDEPRDANGTSIITGQAKGSLWSTSNSKRIQHIVSKQPKLILAVSESTDTLMQQVKGKRRADRIRLKEDLILDSTHSDSSPTIAYLPPRTANLILASLGSSLEQLKQEITERRKPASKAFKTSLSLSFGYKIVDVKAQNVLGYLEGTDLKDELLVITAHYDHIGINPDGQINNGADDDGSGVTGVLEIAKAFAQAKKDGHPPRRSILFMTVTGEEKGLLGSDYYTRHPVLPLGSTIANLNIDMIGRIDPAHFSKKEYVYLVGSDKLSSELHRISEDANKRYTRLDLDYRYNDPNDPERIYYRSDHYNFAKNNIPVIFYFNGVHEDYHDVGDTVDKIDFRLLSKRAQLVFYTAWDLVTRDTKPIVDSNKK